MMPMSHLEAIIGAFLAKENAEHNDNIKQIAEFKGLKVIDVIKNPNLAVIMHILRIPVLLILNLQKN